MNMILCLPFIFAITTLSLKITNEITFAMSRTHQLWQRYELLHYCGRLEALKLNIEAVKSYLDSLNISDDELSRAQDLLQKRYGRWFDSDSLRAAVCPSLMQFISVYQQQNELLPLVYPNWTYAVHIVGQDWRNKQVGDD